MFLSFEILVDYNLLYFSVASSSSSSCTVVMSMTYLHFDNDYPTLFGHVQVSFVEEALACQK